MTIARLEPDHYVVPLPTPLSDRTHRTIRRFELVTVRIGDAEGAGYTYTVTSHGAHDLTVRLLAAVPNRSYLEVHGFGLDRFIAEPLRIEDGLAIAPDTPGHGVRLDRAALEPRHAR